MSTTQWHSFDCWMHECNERGDSSQQRVISSHLISSHLISPLIQLTLRDAQSRFIRRLIASLIDTLSEQRITSHETRELISIKHSLTAAAVNSGLLHQSIVTVCKRQRNLQKSGLASLQLRRESKRSVMTMSFSSSSRRASRTASLLICCALLSAVAQSQLQLKSNSVSIEMQTITNNNAVMRVHAADAPSTSSSRPGSTASATVASFLLPFAPGPTGGSAIRDLRQWMSSDAAIQSRLGLSQMHQLTFWQKCGQVPTVFRRTLEYNRLHQRFEDSMQYFLDSELQLSQHSLERLALKRTGAMLSTHYMLRNESPEACVDLVRRFLAHYAKQQWRGVDLYELLMYELDRAL